MVQTLQARYEAALTAQGLHVMARRPKAIVMAHPDDTSTRYYLGNAGSLRSGPNREKSIPVPDSIKRALLAGTFSAEMFGRLRQLARA